MENDSSVSRTQLLSHAFKNRTKHQHSLKKLERKKKINATSNCSILFKRNLRCSEVYIYLSTFLPTYQYNDLRDQKQRWWVLKVEGGILWKTKWEWMTFPPMKEINNKNSVGGRKKPTFFWSDDQVKESEGGQKKRHHSCLLKVVIISKFVNSWFYVLSFFRFTIVNWVLLRLFFTYITDFIPSLGYVFVLIHMCLTSYY